MKKTTSKLSLLLLLGFSVHSASAQVYGGNIVGYYNLTIYSGDNLIANQLENSHGQTLNALISLDYSSDSIPNGATYTPWNPVAQALLPVSTYDASTHLWDINYSLNLGQGGILHSPTQFTNTFVGNVHIYSNILTEFGGHENWQPNYADGLYLISSPVPVSGPVSSMFPNVTGRAPNDGEWVKILDPATQVYTTTTFHDGSGWDNGNPVISVGKSAWVNLGPTNVADPVPEPATFSLVGLGIGLLFLRHHKSA